MKKINIGKFKLGKKEKEVQNTDINEYNNSNTSSKDLGSEANEELDEPKTAESKVKPKTTKDEIAELLKPIAIHEAKSAFYKAKLAKVVLSKGATVAAKTSKKAYESFKNKKSSK